MIDKPKKYCDGIDCAFCSEKEPCIYKIANRLEDELYKLKQLIIRIDHSYKNTQEELEQTLAEIKEIAGLSIAHFDIGYLKQAINEILQKCEVNNDRK